MKSKCLFYYDESGHSRSLTLNTLNADNYDDYFVACIVGFEEKNKRCVENDYLAFESEYKEYYQVEELKSTILGKRKYKYGLASFKDKDLDFLNDYLDVLIKHNVYVYFSAINKIEYLVFQLLANYENCILFDADVLRYSITKAISIYRPQKVIKAIYKGQSFSKELRHFLKERLVINKDKKHKEQENRIFEQALFILSDNADLETLNWDYDGPFFGFNKYLIENHINTDRIIVDKEGSGKTKEAAIKSGFVKSVEKDSKEEFGIRMADVLCGLINGFLCSTIESLRYKDTEQVNDKTLLEPNWFNITKKQQSVYKKLRTVIVDQRSSWYKTFCSNYSDYVSYFICLLNYISDSTIEFLDENRLTNPEYLNTYACSVLDERYSMLKSKLKIEPAFIEDDYYYNGQGAKEYLDEAKRTKITINDGESKEFVVLSAGIVHKTDTPTITIQTKTGPMALDLPKEYYKWAFDLVALANMGERILPAKVVFSKYKGQYYVDIL